MFALRRFQKKKPVESIVAHESQQRPGSHESVAATTPASATSAEAGKQTKIKKVPWRNRLFGHPEKKETKEVEEGKESTCEPKPKATKTPWWRRLLTCCKRKHRVAPAATSDEEKEKKEEKKNRSSPAGNCHLDEVVAFSVAVEEFLQSTELPDLNPFMVDLLQAQFSSTKGSQVGVGDGVRGSTINHFGFPNLGQSCYINSSLQSLLTLEDFVSDVSRQDLVWSSFPEARLMRTFMAIRDARVSTSAQSKVRLLRSFKEAVSAQAPEFRDHQQKDAHEFLTSVLDQMRSLSPSLQETAANMGTRYTCPVEDHLVFKMENTRTCSRCGAQSRRQEEFTNLSLDLVPGGSVEKILEEYQKETALDYKCECGGSESSQKPAFETLPSVLILHIKRFRFTPSWQLVKVRDPVMLNRELVVSSKQGGSCYSLVSTVSHLGASGDKGHYICDSVHPDERPDTTTDRWLTFNDAAVSETTGVSVCKERQKSAYILFYKRQV
ncbi:ubiquitin carboxyl-terminal hydrolase 37-like isoform X1 [Thunnus maccoyii]|uniref:ubiquitin carboxyl-terminal hydrolase 37-like isoform X1 n=1 Tax=Thunnus maccoyii TaxID=8240 RepID=UPI001C4B06B8|nr:ubiquitin carboxyl-terminal hydrolase 37-like isoform X1 [Thunnus maccoyii]